MKEQEPREKPIRYATWYNDKGNYEPVIVEDTYDTFALIHTPHFVTWVEINELHPPRPDAAEEFKRMTEKFWSDVQREIERVREYGKGI